MLGKQLNNSCLGALYLQDFELVQSLCPLFIRPAGEVVRQLLDNWFLIFSPNPQTAYISCRNGTENEAYIKSGITRTFLSPGCKMNLNLHLLQADFSLNLPEDIIHFSWDWDTSKVTPNLDNYMKTLFDKGNPNPTLRDLNELKLQELRTRDSKETRIRDMQKFIHLENEIELLRESKTPDLNELKVKTKRPQKAVANIFIAFILSIVALVLIALLILWQCGKDFLFKYTFFQRFMHPALRHALQLLSQLRESRQPHPQHPPPRAPPENPDTAMAVYQPFVTQSHPPRPSVRVIPASPPPGYQQPRGLPITPNVYRRYPDLSQAEYNPYALVANPPI